MINRKLNLVFALVLITILSACDVVEGPKKDYSAIQGTSERKVLLEEFTGHRCPNCPNANAEAQVLDSLFEGKLIIISVHATAFADPVPSLGYPTDYRTDMGTELAPYLDADTDGLPNGAINREFNESKSFYVWKFSEWAGVITNELAEAPALSMDLTSTYDEGTREANITVDMEYFESQPSSNQLVVVITEDSLVSKQTDLFTEYDNYVHRHVLRGSITSGTFGEQVKSSEIGIGEKFTRTFTYTVSPDWDPAHCEIVAYVHDFASREILQAEEVHLK